MIFDVWGIFKLFSSLVLSFFRPLLFDLEIFRFILSVFRRIRCLPQMPSLI